MFIQWFSYSLKGRWKSMENPENQFVYVPTEINKLTVWFSGTQVFTSLSLDYFKNQISPLGSPCELMDP